MAALRLYHIPIFMGLDLTPWPLLPSFTVALLPLLFPFCLSLINFGPLISALIKTHSDPLHTGLLSLSMRFLSTFSSRRTTAGYHVYTSAEDKDPWRQRLCSFLLCNPNAYCSIASSFPNTKEWISEYKEQRFTELKVMEAAKSQKHGAGTWSASVEGLLVGGDSAKSQVSARHQMVTHSELLSLYLSFSSYKVTNAVIRGRPAWLHLTRSPKGPTSISLINDFRSKNQYEFWKRQTPDHSQGTF